MRKPLASSTHAALNFVNHHEPIFVVTKGTNITEIVQVHGVHATFTLDGFKKHGHHVGIVFSGLFQSCNVIQGHTQEALDQRPKTLLNFGVARGTQGGNAAAVKGSFVDHDDRIVDAFVMTELAR